MTGLLNQGRLKPTPLISKTVSLEEAPEYFYTLAHEPGNLIKVVTVDKQ